MKKAFIEQFLFGFILILGTLAFVATSVDEYSNRNKIIDLKNIALQTGKAMAKSYEENMDMCFSKTITENLLQQSALGRDILAKSANGKIDFDYNFYDLTGTDNTPDGQPDQVQVIIDGYEYNSFWYKFFDKDSFTFNQISKNFPIDTPKTVTIRYGDRPQASFQNIFGTYQLDSNNCVTNMKMHMANSKEWNKWERTDSEGNRIPIANKFQSPPTYVFAIANGNNHFNQPADNAPIELKSPHCFDSNTYPNLKINGVTKQGQVGNAYTGNTFFQHQKLNADGVEHFHIIPSSIIDKYIYFKNNIYTSGGNERDRYEAFKRYADALNQDENPNNDINYTSDPNDEYKYALEDLDSRQSDMDFTDMLLNSTRLVIPNKKDNYSVAEDGKIVFDNGYCENESENIPPNLELQGCPVTMDEDTSININWNASDSDGRIISKEASTLNGIAIVNDNGTITYSPNLNFYGEDMITVVVKDDDDAIARKDCHITINDVNDPPTITGSPITIAKVKIPYNFRAVGDDVDGDVLTYSIKNKPIWANFNTSDGTLSGTPFEQHIALYENIVISVSDNKGGASQLTAFNIEVISDNKAPILGSSIPDQTIKEGEIFTYNISPHFSDPNADHLSYTIKATIDGTPINWLSISKDGQITSIKIPRSYVGKTIVVTVTASDGKASVSDTFNISIKNSINVPNFFHTFDNDLQNWQGQNADIMWEKYKNDGKLKILSKIRTLTVTGFNFNFGPAFANKKVIIEFDMYFSSYWNNNYDFYYVYINRKAAEGLKGYLNNTNHIVGPEKLKYENFSTDGNGILYLAIGTYNFYTSKFAYIDNVSVKIK